MDELTPAQLSQTVAELADELSQVARLRSGDLMVVGCSSSEILGRRIGSFSSPQVGRAVVEGLLPTLHARGIWLVAQCCEHLNRALVVERAALAPRSPIVNAVPQPKAGGSFASAVYQAFTDPVLVEEVSADAGMDIGDTFIGMHLHPVAVPVRLSRDHLGSAHLTAARTRPRYIGGERAVYDRSLEVSGLPA